VVLKLVLVCVLYFLRITLKTTKNYISSISGNIKPEEGILKTWQAENY
jgi:hypothetical protein